MRRFCLILCVVSAIIFNAAAEDSDSIYAENIKYEYEMFYNESSGKPDCMGKLSFSVKLPPNAARVIVKWSRAHKLPSDRIFLSATISAVIQDGEFVYNFNRENFSWGVYFQIAVRDIDGNDLIAPIYCTSDYMKPDDLQEIMDWLSSVEEVPSNEFAITRDAANLIIDAESKGSLSIFSTEGRRLFYEHDQSHFEIPLAVLKSQIIIARFTSNNETKTQKILLK